MKFDIAVIGGGPGGYTAATKAAALGNSVVLFEKSELGGTCLNRGCIPTKAMLHASETYLAMQHADKLGLHAENISYDWSQIHQRKNFVVSSLRDGIAKLMKANKVTVVNAVAQIVKPHFIVSGEEEYEADNIIIATGSVPFCPPITGINLPGVYTSNELLEGEGQNMKSMVVIGGGVIGVECASIYLALGYKVTIVELADHILPPMDKEIAQRLTMYLKKQGATIVTKANVKEISGEPGAMKVTYVDKKETEIVVEAEGVLVATGRKANVEGLFGEGVEIELERGAVVADASGKTSLEGVYVIGDAKARNIQLAHVASAQAENVVAAIMGHAMPVDESVIPSCVYTAPEIASVGMTEDQAKAAGIKTKAGKYLTGANGKCLIEDSESGYIKIVADAETNVIIGAQLVCPRATDMIAELTIAVQKKMTVQELLAVVHPHPTFCEMVYGAVEELMKK